jgi:hypothetical protein
MFEKFAKKNQKNQKRGFEKKKTGKINLTGDSMLVWSERRGYRW